jgi:predicted heme/steroid binding protein
VHLLSLSGIRGPAARGVTIIFTFISQSSIIPRMKSPLHSPDRIIIGIYFLIMLFPSAAFATPDYSRQTGFACGRCHIDVIGGGQLTQAGKSFLADLKLKGLYRPLTLGRQIVRLGIGYLHLMSAILWFGTILYVHLLLKPVYASKGLPKGELRLGWFSMIVVLITGVLLTVARVPSLEMFYTTRFGVLLGIKIFLYLVMLSSAIVVTLFIGPRLKKQKTLTASLESGVCTLDELSQYDGRDGRPAYVAYKGTIYCMTKSRLWKNGSHVMKHSAGRDLTGLLETAPHGEDKVLAMPVVGRLLADGEQIKRPFHERLFYFFAYMNLVLVFVITFVIALWRWW